MTNKEVMQMALEALEYAEKHHGGDDCYAGTIEELRTALAQPEQKPVAWMYEYGTDHGDAVNQIFWHKNLRLEKPTGLVRNVVPLYTAPPQPKQEPVAMVQDLDEVRRKHLVYELGFNWTDPLYTAPPQREWVGLTKEEAFDLLVKHKDKPSSLSAAVENLLREKNNG